MLKGVSVGSPALGPLHLSNTVSGPGYFLSRRQALSVPGCCLSGRREAFACVHFFFRAAQRPRTAVLACELHGPLRIFCRPGGSGPVTRALPGATRAEACAVRASDFIPKAAQRERGHYKRAGCSAQRAGVPDSRAGQGLHKGPIPWTRVTVVTVRVYWTCARVSSRETASALTSTCEVDRIA